MFARLEELEQRQLLTVSLSAGLLSILGTQGNDTVYVNRDAAGNLVVTDNGAVSSFHESQVSSISVNLLGGNDYLNSYASVSRPMNVNGGAGNDVLYGGGMNDLIQGGGDRDSIYGQGGNDTLDGGVGGFASYADNTGDDYLYGGDGNDVLHASDVGNCYLNGGNGDDWLYGWQGNDTLDGGYGNDVLYGFTGNDVIRGSFGNDSLYGQDGNDQLYGEAGNDALYGGNGDDRTWGDGSSVHDFHAYPWAPDVGINVATGDVDGDGHDDVITGSANYSSHVLAFSGRDGSMIRNFMAYPWAPDVGVTVAAGDVNADGYDDIITGSAKYSSHVRIFSGRDGAILRDFHAYPWAPDVGINVAAGDINGDGYADVVTGSKRYSSHVLAFSGRDGSVLLNFHAYPWAGDVGVTVAAGDVNGDGRADIITGSANYSSHVRAFSGRDGAVLRDFHAYPGYNPGVTVAAGDVNGDGYSDIITGSANNSTHVLAFSGRDGSILRNLMAYPWAQGVGVSVAAGDIDRDGSADIVTGSRAYSSHVQVFGLSGGNDFIDSGAGNDHVDGSVGDDTLIGGEGSDTIYGHDGNDFLQGTAGQDRFDGGRGNDTLDAVLDFGVFIQERGSSIISASARIGADAGTDTLTIRLEVGPLISSYITPIATTVQRATKSLDGVINFLKSDIPFLPGTTWVSLFGGDVVKFIDTVDGFNRLTFNETASGNIPLGSYTLTNGDQITSAPPAYWLPVLQPFIDKTKPLGFHFNLLEDPRSVADLVLGRPVELISYTLPRLDLHYHGEQQKTVPIWGPFSATFTLQEDLRLTAGATFGFDTAGLFSGNFLDGFYVRDASVVLNASVGGGVEVSAAIVFAGIDGRFAGTIGVTPRDANGDGKVRLAEIIQMTTLDSMFSVSGRLDYAVSVYAGADLSWIPFLNLGRREVRETILSGSIAIL